MSWKRLTIPLFFLLIASLLFGGLFYEIERGKECFVGSPCLWWNKELLTPELSEGLPNNTRILIQNTRKVIVKDMLHSTWLALITFTSVGYGRIHPNTALGKMVAMVAMVFGACYTAMPLTLVGGQFYACYQHEQGVRGGTGISKVCIANFDDCNIVRLQFLGEGASSTKKHEKVNMLQVGSRRN